MRELSEWHKTRFRGGAAELIDGADENIVAAHRFLCRIISLEDSNFSLLLLKCIYYFLFFSFPDKNGRPSVCLEILKKANGHNLTPKNPYPVFARAGFLGIKTSLLNKKGLKTTKSTEAETVTLMFSDKKVFNGLIAFEKGAETRFKLSEKALFKKMFPYFITADFSFLQDDELFIKKHYLSGYGEETAELCEKINRALLGVSMLYDIKTDYPSLLTVRRSAMKKGKNSFLFSLEFGKRKAAFIFTARLSRKIVSQLCDSIEDYSPSFIWRFFHDGDCSCRDCYIVDKKIVYKNKVFSVPFSEKTVSFPVKSEEDFEDVLGIIGLILSNLPSYITFLKAVKTYKDTKE